MKEYKLKSGNILRVLQDPDPESPNKWDNEDMFLVYDHRNFSVKREGFEPRDIFNALSLECPKEPISDDYKTEEEYIDARDEYYADIDDVNSIKAKFLDYYIFPVDAYIHSGVHLSLANTKNYPDEKCDVSTTGYILVKRDSILPNGSEEKGGSLIARELAENLIETWNQYLSGEVYTAELLKPVKYYKISEEELENIVSFDIAPSGIEVIDSYRFRDKAIEQIEYSLLETFGGFYGSDDPKENGMLEHIGEEILEDNDK